MKDLIARAVYDDYDDYLEKQGGSFLFRTLQGGLTNYTNTALATYSPQEQPKPGEKDLYDRATEFFFGAEDMLAQNNQLAALQQQTSQPSGPPEGAPNLSDMQASAYGIEPGAMVDTLAGSILGGIDGITFDDDMRARLGNATVGLGDPDAQAITTDSPDSLAYLERLNQEPIKLSNQPENFSLPSLNFLTDSELQLPVNSDDFDLSFLNEPFLFGEFKVNNDSVQIASAKEAQMNAAAGYQNALDSYSGLQNLNQLVNSGKATADQKLAYHNALTSAAGTSKAAKNLADNLSGAPESLGVHVTGSRTKAAYKDVLKNLGSNITTSQESIRTATRELKVDLMSPAERTQAVSGLLNKGLKHDGKGYVTNASREEVRMTQTILNKEGYGVHDAKGKIQPLTVDGGFGRIPSENSAFFSNTAKASGHFIYRDLIESNSKKIGLPPALFSSIVDRESGFNINAKSNTGVSGLVQMTIGTAEYMGIFKAGKLDGRKTPELAIDAGIRYINEQVERFGPTAADTLESFKFAAAGYNKGPGKTDNSNGVAGLISDQFSGLDAKAFGGNNRFWDNLINGVKDSRGKQVGPVVSKHDPKTEEVYGYVNNIFYSDQKSGTINGGRYNYYQQLYKNRN